LNEIVRRILKDMKDEALLEKLCTLSNADWNSLIMEAMRLRMQNTAPTQVLKNHCENRFTLPANADPVAYHRLEAELLKLAENMNMQSVLLSPAAPMGSCAVFGCVDQNNVLSALRNTELLADPTNMLCIIAAQRIREGALDPNVCGHLCTTARVARAQKPAKARQLAHFGLFCIVSYGRDTGSYGCESKLLMEQLAYYKRLLQDRYAAKLAVTLRKRAGYADADGFFCCMADVFAAQMPDVPLELDPNCADHGYYRGVNFKIYMLKDGEKLEIGDGGFVDWLQRLSGNRKLRCLISGVGIERLMML